MKNSSLTIFLAVMSGIACAARENGTVCPFDAGDPGSIHAFAERMLVHRDPAAAAANRNRIFLALDKMDTLAVRGDFTNRVRYAEARETVGVLYGMTRFLTLARLTREELRKEFGEMPDLRLPTSDPAVLAHRRLLDLNRTALANEEVEPGDATHPFWNAHARFFTYAPAFRFKTVPGAAEYRFHVYDRNQDVHEFVAKSPYASLRPVWDAVPAGPTRVVCLAVDAKGETVGLAGERVFRRLEPFYPNGYAPAKRSYAEAVELVNGYLRDWPELKEIIATGKADLTHETNIVNYPSKMLPWAIRLLIARGEIREARIVADYLMSLREPAGSPLEHFTPTYVGDYFICRRNRGQTMMHYPAAGAGGFLDMYEACKDVKYLEAAEQTARTYLKLQREDGTWALKYELATGKVTSSNALMPNGVIDFLERLYGLTGRMEYRTAADRAFAFIEKGPLTDWNWEGQFEDIHPASENYTNLTKHYACATAMYLLKRFPGDAKRLDQARRLLRFAEDQFVVWVRPCDGDGQGYGHVTYYPYSTWRCPAALEQYSCYQPIDASVAKLIRTYLALYAADGNPLDLAKAKALGDSMVNNQDDNGRIRTYWIPEADDAGDPDAGAVRLPDGGDWFNCMGVSAMALAQLKAVTESVPPVAAGENGFVPLFNGKDLSGWEGATNTYRVTSEGYLTCTQTGGRGESGAKNLWTAKDYANFTLRFDVKLPPNANNGLGIRTRPNGWCSREGMELQLLDDWGDAYNGSNKLVDVHYTGSIYGVVPPARKVNGESYLNKPGEWNTVEVTADGPRIVFVLNGATIVDADVSKYSTDGTVPADGIKRPGLHNKTGRIHWCGHGHNIFWRNIRIKELP